MIKSYLNRGISTPIAIGIVLILVIIVGSFTWWQYSEIRKEETKLPEIEIPGKKFTEVSFEELKKGENKIGGITVERIEPERVEPNSVLIEYSLFERTSRGFFFGAFVFNHEKNKYVIESIESMGTENLYMNYLYLLADNKLHPIEFEGSPFSPLWFRAAGVEVPEPGYLLIDYNNYLYVISWSVGEGGYRHFYGLTEIHILDKNGEVTDNKYFDKYSERVPEGVSFVYPKATSLIDKDKELYIKISNAEDNINKYYLLSGGNLIESSF